MTDTQAPSPPRGPQQGPPQGRPQGYPQGPPQGPQRYVQGPPQWNWNAQSNPSPMRLFSLLNWLAIVLLPLGILTEIIVNLVDGNYYDNKVAQCFESIGYNAVFVGGLALVGGLIVTALKKKN